MPVDLKFLRAVQKAGWQVQAADGDRCIARCPSPGCAVRVSLAPGKTLPERSSPSFAIERPIEGFEDARAFLRDRREDLLLTIREVEEIAGMSVDFLAKFEREDWATAGTVRQPNVQTFVEWAQALGYRVVLVPSELPPYALRMIEQTRARAASRLKRQHLERARRQSR